MITTRTATLADVPAILQMEAISIKHPWSEDDIKALMDEPSGVAGKIAVVVEIDGAVASYIGASYILDECEIGNVCTHPDYRRQGAAEAVLRELISRCAALNIQSVFLEVSSTNDAAIALYKKLGFTQYNMRADYYGKGDDALLFVYKI